jgi:isopentenyl-diphosphate Delta-isomerase
MDVILVDENDNETGVIEKLQAHELGLLHRALSVIIFNDTGKMLLQKRAAEKYHSAGLWTNACCSHPLPGEEVATAAHRRLREEMGIETALQFAGTFIYRTTFANGLTEHEYDHLFTGIYNGVPQPDPAEVSEWKWMSMADLHRDLKSNAAHYSFWFHLIIEKFFNSHEHITH